MRFEWDEHKNRANIRKHGIDFRDAAYAFADPRALNIPGDEHSEEEERWRRRRCADPGQRSTEKGHRDR